MKATPADRSLVYCIFRPALIKLGRNRYRNSPADVRRIIAARDWKVHVRVKHFKAVVPKDFRTRDSLIALAVWQLSRLSIDPGDDVGIVGPLIPGMYLTAEDVGKLVIRYPRIGRLLGKLERSKGPQRQPQLQGLSEVRLALLHYGHRCAQFGLAVELGRAWHTVREIRDIVGAPAQHATNKFFRDTLREYRIPFRSAPGRRPHCVKTRRVASKSR